MARSGLYDGKWPFSEKPRNDEEAKAKQKRRRVRAGCEPLQKDYHRNRRRRTWQEMHDQGRRVAINRYSKNGRAA